MATAAPITDRGRTEKALDILAQVQTLRAFRNNGGFNTAKAQNQLLCRLTPSELVFVLSQLGYDRASSKKDESNHDPRNIAH